MPTALIVEFVATHRDEHGVDPICAPLRGTAVQIAPRLLVDPHGCQLR
ncbi:hypothetical protein [Rhodococcus sp. HNM0569]|nr:hypothetical protein [Rhodococcus sp. HNM0569]NLU83419.1 hypothetical protein [Rhodococcus sp. HNM0569]